MKAKVTILLISVLLSGCSTLSDKAQNYKRAGEMAANPDCIELKYKRSGTDINAKVSFEERRCAGEGCVCSE